MIKTLDIISYGRFKNVRFDLAPFTVFLGKNEAGKTTLFDALFEKICEGSARKQGDIWGRLKKRYGDDRKVEASGTVPFFYDGREFLELYAIRAGQISIEAEKGYSWTEAAKKSLYSHGYNPAEIAEKLDKISVPDPHSKIYRQYESLKKELSETEALIRDYGLQEKNILDSRHKLSDADKELAELEGRKKEAEEELRTVNAAMEALGKERTLSSTVRDRNFVAEILMHRNKLEEYSEFSPEKIQEYDEIFNGLDDLKNKAAEAAAAAQASSAALENAERALSAMKEERKNISSNASAVAGRMIPEVNKIIQNYDPVERFPWVRYLFLSLLIVGIVVGGAFIADSAYKSLGFSICILCVAFIALEYKYLFAVEGSVPVKAFPVRKMEAVYKKWEKNGLNRALIESSSLEELQENLYNIKAHAQVLELNIRNAEQERKNAAQSAEKYITEAEDYSGRIAEAENKAAEWLKNFKCTSRDEFIIKAEKRNSLAGQVESGLEKVEELRRIEECESYDALLGLLDYRARTLEKNGVRSYQEIDREYSEKDARRKELTSFLRLAEEDAADLKVRRENVSVSFNKDLSKITDELSLYRRRRGEIEKEIASEELRRRAAAAAAAVYRDIDSDSSVRFASLARSLNRYLSKILDGSEIEVRGLSLDEIYVKDMEGAKRRLEYLSSGTRDCFMLAARITMALESRRGQEGILLLDDPFQSLDSDRVNSAFEILRSFAEETKWQIILFTKDMDIAAAAREYAGAELHGLA